MLKNILVVDDNEINRKILHNILRKDYQIAEACNGEDALKILWKSHETISAVLLDIAMPVMDGYEVLEQMRKSETLSHIPVIVATGNTEKDAEVKALALGANDFVVKPYNPAILKHRLRNTIKLRETAAAANAVKWDKLTGLYSREAFFDQVAEMVSAQEPGFYVLACFDINGFKVINDQYGTQKGDDILRHIANIFRSGFEPAGGICCRVAADDFAVLYPRSFMESDELEQIRKQAALLGGSIRPVTFSIGRYVIDDLSLSVSAMYDRAVLAETSVKGRYDTHIAQFDKSMRDRLLREQQIVTEMNKALEEGQFEAWLQPQYNHVSGALIGAEALVRWRHPENGLLIPPGEFIPVFERNGFIYEMDKYVWREVCRLLRKWLDGGRSPLPISVNISRYDVFREDFFETVTGYVEEYHIPIDLLRLEITETAFAQSTEQIVAVIKRMIDYGFTVEIDDFGSGYSSLNTLKDVPASILKLDMHFLEDTAVSQRGGNILESIVRMAKWLGMSVIAEGVETQAQADYLKSIGCYLVQGYLYAKPMPVKEYETLASQSVKKGEIMALETIDMLDNNTFWNPNSMETLIFNSYIGGACVFEYRDGKIELLRVNDKYARELGGSISIEEALALDFANHMDGRNLSMMYENIEAAIASGAESTCELCLSGLSGENTHSYIRITVRVIASAGDRRLFYCSIINMTAQREAEQQIIQSSEQLRFLNEVAHDLLTQTDADKGIEEVLCRILAYFSGDRAYVIELDSVHGVSNNTYETCAEGISSQKNFLQEIPLETSPFWFNAFEQDGFVSIEDVTKLDEHRAEERRILSEQGIHSLIAVPLRRDGQLIGFLGVDDPRRQQTHIGHLQATGDYVAAMLCRRDLNAKIENDNKTLVGLMNDTPGGFVRMKVIGKDRIIPVYFNSGFCKLVGMDKDELMEKYRESAMWGVHPDDLEIVENAVHEMLTTGEARSAKYRLRHGNGGYVGVMIFGRMTHDISGDAFFNVYYTDLSNEEKKELSFRDMLPVALAAMMESAAELSFVKDKHFHYMCCSRAFAKLAGLKSEKDIVGKTDYDLFDPTQADRYRENDSRLLETGEPLVDCEEPLPSTDSVARYASTSKYLLHDSSGSVIGLYGIGWDITRTRELARERTYQEALDTSIPLCTIIFSCHNGELLHVGGTLLSELGYTREEYERIHADNLRGFVLDEDYGTAFRSVLPIKADSPQNIEQEFRVCAKDGSVAWLYEKGRLMELNGERVYLVVFVNITQRKEIEERLRVSEEEIRLAMEQMGRVICLYDIKTHMLTMPAAYVKKHGFSSNRLKLPECLEKTTYLDDASRTTFIAFYKAILRGEASGTKETYIKCADGSWCWEYGEFATIFNSNGTPVKAIVTLEDTTRRHLLENEIQTRRENERVWQLVAEHSNRQIYRYDIATDTARVDSAIGEPIIRTKILVSESAIEKGAILPESVEDYRRIFSEIKEGKPTGEAKIHINPSGEPRWIDIKYSVIYDEDHTPKFAVLSVLDITESHEKELAYDRYLQTISHDVTSESVMIYLEADLTTGITEKQGGALLPDDFPAIGEKRSEVIQYIVKNYILPEEESRYLEFFSREHLITQFSDGQKNLSAEWAVSLPDGSHGFIRSELQMIQDPYTGHIKVYTILRDITKEKFAALDVKKKAETDGMTGVYNKTTAENLISSRLSRAEAAPCALLVVDLDSLKTFNDTLGHAQGDKAIQLIGEALHTQFRQTDIVGRIGGDEFIAFLDNCGTESWLSSAMRTFMKRLSAIRIGEQKQLPLRVSVGIAFGVTARDTYDTLFQQADKALYHVKRNGKNNFAFYTPEMEQAAYQYTPYIEEQADFFSNEDLESLLATFSAVYPMVISVNLTQNRYCKLQYKDNAVRPHVDTGVFDELVAGIADTVHPADRKSFIKAFTRSNLLAAHGCGKKMVSFKGRQFCGGAYRLIQTDVIFVQSSGTEDVLELTMAREVGTIDKDG